MENKEYIHAKITIPELKDKDFNGFIYRNGKETYITFNEIPYPDNTWKAIDVLYANTGEKFYTGIHCSVFTYGHSEMKYLISEFYEGKLPGNSNDTYFEKLTAEVFFLNQWLRPKQIEYKSVSDPYLIAVYGNKNKPYSFAINSNITLIIEGYIKFSTRYDEVVINEKSFLSLVSEKKISRSELFFKFYYFLIFFVLFCKRVPRTINLSFYTESEEFKLLGLHTQGDKSDFITLLNFNDLTNLDIVLLRYYNNAETYGEVIQLLEKSLEMANQEVCFLHLTQALELLHKTRFENDKAIEEQIAKEVDSSFRPQQKSKRWNQLMRYYHFYQLSIKLDLNINFQGDHIEFLRRLRNSRNYYTHYDKKGYVWKYMELYPVNNILMTWLRSMILYDLSVEPAKIKKSVRMEMKSFREENIFENPFSMRYKNYFSK